MTKGLCYVDNRAVNFVGQMREDRSDLYCLVFGRTPSHTAAESDCEWQIWRLYFDGNQVVTEYAGGSKYNLKWSDRSTYFDPCPPGAKPWTCLEEASQAGLCGGARYRDVIVTDAWTPLSDGLFARNVMSIQYRDRSPGPKPDIKINWAPDVLVPVGWVGMRMELDEERQYDIKQNIVPYARCDTGTGTVTISVAEIE